MIVPAGVLVTAEWCSTVAALLGHSIRRDRYL
jgi:hypothetical protein